MEILPSTNWTEPASGPTETYLVDGQHHYHIPPFLRSSLDLITWDSEADGLFDGEADQQFRGLDRLRCKGAEVPRVDGPMVPFYTCRGRCLLHEGQQAGATRRRGFSRGNAVFQTL